MPLAQSFIFTTDAIVLALGLFVLMVVFLYLGVLFRGIRQADAPELKESRGPVVSSMLGLLAFLLAFAFGMSGNRFDARRQVVVDEANAMGTAILRADLYPADVRSAFRADFQQYVEARIDYYEAGADLEKIQAARDRSGVVGAKLWERAMQHSSGQVTVASMQMVPALNEMFDLAATRWVGEQSRVPDIVIWMLFIVAIVSAFFHGYSSGKTMDWFAGTSFCLLIAVVINITLDLDRPRRGVITVAVSHEAILELRKMF